MDKNNVELKARNKVIAFLIILVLLFASLFAATSVYIIRSKKNTNKDTATTTSQTFSTLSALYVGELKADDGTTFNNEKQVRLYVYEDGSFRYYKEPGLATCTVGYCTFNDTEFVLHGIVVCANDPGRTIINDNVTLKINSDGSFTDSKLNVTLKKSTEEFKNENGIISTELRNALDNHFLD